MKVFWRNIHLWLSLAAGLIFFVECISGTLLVFEDEITEALHPQRYHVKEGEKQLPLDDLVQSFQKEFPKKEKIASVKVYADNSKTIEISTGSGKRGAKGERKLGFINPYTGVVTAVINPAEKTFFTFMLDVHQTLLAGKVGKTILGVSTFVVFVILITGLILWFPKKRKMLSARLKLKTDGGWKRINHDLHVVIGFYCSFFLFILLITSLAWSFTWANNALYTITGSKPGLPEPKKSVSAIASGTGITYQQALEAGKKQFPNAPYWSVSMAKKPDDVITVTSASTDALHRNGFDNLSIDQRTGQILSVSLLKDLPGGWQLRRYMKPIHTGAIGGIPTKILAFLVSLFSATFPITGTIMWLNRLKKKRKKKNKLALVPVTA